MAQDNARDSRILVTGAAGFIGTRFVEACRNLGLPVISVDHPEYFRARTEHAGTEYGEIVDRASLFEWLEQKRPALKAVIHLGACADTTNLDEEHHRRMNLEYSQKLWSYCTREGIPFVYASSAATYGEGELGYDDDEALIPRLRALNPYGESKRLFDVWALEQERQGNHPPFWSGFKFFNVYGPGERHKGKMASVIVHAFDQIKKTGRMKLFKSHREGIAHGHQQRDFVYVGDVVKVLNFAWSGSPLGALNGAPGLKRGIYNLGTGQARTFLDLARGVFRAMGAPEQIEFIDTPEALRERYQYFTEAKMDRLKKAGYPLPFTRLEDGIREYVNALNKGPS